VYARKLSEFNCRGNFYHLHDPIQGTEQTSGEEVAFLENVPVALQPTSTQRLSTRQAGEVTASQWTAYLDPSGPIVPKVGDVFKLVTVCFGNDPLAGREGTRFDVRDVAATPGEVRLSLAETDRS
jgi:hypothetical protein